MLSQVTKRSEAELCNGVFVVCGIWNAENGVPPVNPGGRVAAAGHIELGAASPRENSLAKLEFEAIFIFRFGC